MIVVCGLDKSGTGINPVDLLQVRKHTILDELSPYASVVAVAYQDRFLGSFLISPEEFGVSIHPQSIQITNTKDCIQKANYYALQGTNLIFADFLAMNAALGLFAERYLSRADAVTKDGLNSKYLRECFQECRQCISSGLAFGALSNYVKASGGTIQFA